jgi:Tol biopolymer transport system component
MLAGAAMLLPRGAVPTTAARSVHFDISPPEGHVFPGANGVPRFAVSPDGTQVVVSVARAAVSEQLYLRRLDDAELRPIDGTQSAATAGDTVQQPFFSPDGRYVAFFSGAESALNRVPTAGGRVERLATLPTQNCGGSWHGDVILVSSGGTNGVQRMPSGGGPLSQVTTVDKAAGEAAHLWPQFLPDGQHFLYLALSTGSQSVVWLASLDGTTRIRLTPSDGTARFAPPNQLLFVKDGALVAKTLDMRSWTLTGETSVVSPSVMTATNSRTGVSVSNDGTLVLASGQSTGGNFEVVARDRQGRTLGSGVVESPIGGQWVRLSPDGRRLAFERDSSGTKIWVKDLERNITGRVSTEEGWHRLPVWSPDGRAIAYQSNRAMEGPVALYARDVEGLTPPRLLHRDRDASQMIPEDWSPDGKRLLFRVLSGAGGVDLWTLPMSEAGPPVPYLRDGFRNRQGAFSPDGRWVAYSSNESGSTPQVFVRSFPDPSVAKVQVSGAGGQAPRWRRDGRELFYVDGQYRLVAVPVAVREGIDVGTPVVLFELMSPMTSGALVTGSLFDVSADGQRVYIAAPRALASTQSLTVMTNWSAGLAP